MAASYLSPQLARVEAHTGVPAARTLICRQLRGLGGALGTQITAWHAAHVTEEASLDELRDWMQRCDPTTPVSRSDERFVDFYRFEYEGETLSLRGEDSNAGLPALADAIDLAGEQSCHLFSGFSGTGKSSELLGLKDDLEAHGYVVLIADAFDYLNLRRPLTISELLIVVAAAFGDVASKQMDKDMAATSYLSRFVDFVNQDVDLGGLTLPAGIVDLKLGINTNQPFWMQARDSLAASVGKLREHAHGFVAEIIKKLEETHPNTRGVVFVFDSLEKIRSAQPEGFGAVIESIIDVFVNQAALLRFPCHIIYTLPPYVRQLELGTLYTHVTEVLPAIRVHERQSTVPYAPGVEALSEVVRRRIPVARIFGADETLLKKLVAYSGGHVRLLLTFVRDTLLRVKRTGLPVKAIDVERVLQRHREDVERTLWSERLPLLRDVLEHGELPGMDRSKLPILASLLDDYTVLCYRNGDGWYDVHPLARDKLLQLLEREAAAKRA